MYRVVVLSLLVLASLPTPGVMQANGDLRLTGKPPDPQITEGYGRLEIFLDGEWGTVCGPISRDVADTACYQMGYKASIQNGSVETLKVTEVNESTPNILKVDGCDNSIHTFEQIHILRCDYSISSTDVDNCTRKSNAALQCDGLNTDYYDTQVRLSNGAWPSSGILEVYIEPKLTWGTACFSNFTAGAAYDACRQMGYTSAILYTGVDNPAGSTIWLSSAKCNGTQSCLQSCFSGYPTDPVSHCFGDQQHTVVFLYCTFEPSLAYYHSGSEGLCQYIHIPSNTTLKIIWSFSGLGLLFLVVLVIIAVVAVIVGVIKAKSKRTRYVQVDSDGDAVN